MVFAITPITFSLGNFIFHIKRELVGGMEGMTDVIEGAFSIALLRVCIATSVSSRHIYRKWAVQMIYNINLLLDAAFS